MWAVHGYILVVRSSEDQEGRTALIITVLHSAADRPDARGELKIIEPNAGRRGPSDRISSRDYVRDRRDRDARNLHAPKTYEK